MKCFKCGNDIENNLECPFCGYINKQELKEDTNKENKIVNIIYKILCYIQVVFSIMMALVCFGLEKPFFSFISWMIVAIIFIPKIKLIIIRKVPKIRRWIILIRIILIILAMILLICNLSLIYEDEWISNNGITVILKDNVADIIEDGVKYHGTYTTKYVDGITNINVFNENKKFTFYFKYNDDVTEFYCIKDNEKIYFRKKL